MDDFVLQSTDFHFPGQTAVYHGKVRDMYTIEDKYIIAVTTDRLSTFDVILPKPIPYKGQVLNQMAAYFLESVSDFAPVWLLDTPDPNASVGLLCEPFKVEMVIRGYLVGHAWRQYKAGIRELCGVQLPDGLNEYGRFPEPIITPTTKADAGHDEDISAEEVIAKGIASKEEWKELVSLTRKLFARGQEMSKQRGLILADTKYEFGKHGGKIYLIDEVHTADSARYYYLDSYKSYLKGSAKEKPHQLSKEFVRQWLIDRGFMGRKGDILPELTDEFINQISERYIELYGQLTGVSFKKPDNTEDPLKRIETNVNKSLENLS